jgi:DNA-directed RNA polymerase subunit beta'
VTRSVVRRERMGHIELKTPCSHIWFLRGISSKLSLILGLSMHALEKVVYFASFIITNVDEELKNSTIEQIKQEYKSGKRSIVSEYNKKVKEVKAKREKMLEEGKDEKQVEDDISRELDELEKNKDEKLEELNSTYSESQKELKELKPLEVISESDYQELSLKYGHIFEASIGAEAIRLILEELDLKKKIDELEEELKEAVDSKKGKIIKRLKIFKNLYNNDLRPEWMIMTHVPVIPPDLRPMVALDGGRFAASDLNDLYRRVINRNNRLKQLIDLNAPEVICRNEKRMLQEAVDALLDNSSRQSKTVVASTGQKRQLKSLADSLKGKQGRFRQNLLGKRTDYSGRSVIVVNPKLKLDQCGIPKAMALELFKPFVISKLIHREIVHNVRNATRFIEGGPDIVWDILEEVVKDSYVLLNRAPTLHRLGIQAFKPTLIEGKSIQIHPLVCPAFNADFDGDQMAVHVPLTKEANEEAKNLMLSAHNLLKPATGDPVVAPNQDIVWGAYYITSFKAGTEELADKDLKHFADEQEALLAYDNGVVGLHDPIICNVLESERLRTTVGRIHFNNILPEKLRFVNEVIDKGILKKLVRDCLYIYESEETVKFLDNLKDRTFSIITKSGLSWGLCDLPGFEEREEMIGKAEAKVEEIWQQYEDGLLTDSERSANIIELWTNTKEDITDICKTRIKEGNPVHSMIESGARGSWAQLTQVIGMKGLVTSPAGGIIELPVKGNFKKGFGVLEYFISTHGVRKGLSDTALRTANAGYLTRRLVDVSQDVIITEDDCGDTEGIVITQQESEEMGIKFLKRIIGRYLAQDLVDSKGKTLMKAGELVTEGAVEELRDKDIDRAVIRSTINCKRSRGVCSKCYGYDLGFNKPVKMGTPVGIIAAQSIGEPGTQLTMRTFHTGGVAGQEDITQGLPRVEEIFEARPPKKKAILSEVDGKIKIESEQRTIVDENGKEVLVDNPQVKILKIYYTGKETDKYYYSEAVNEVKLSKDKKASANDPQVKMAVKDGDKVAKGAELFRVGKDKVVKTDDGGIVEVKSKYVKVTREKEKVQEMTVPKGSSVLVNDGDKIAKGDQLTEGSLDLGQLYKLKSKIDVQKYIIKEIQYVYSSQGQPLNEKHIEIIARQMFSRWMIQESGDTGLLPGEVVEEGVLSRENAKVSNGAKAERLMSGITRASLTTDSFLSSASFQETARVLIDAAISGKIDYLEGLKENVIIGCLIPAGTGYKGEKKRVKYD